jgi:competence protein ComGC
MQCSGLRSKITNRKLQIHDQRGYLLVTLMLLFTLIAIAALAILPAVHQQWQRDREDELRHRGTMYMRAVQHYYRKLGRYPNSIDDLENSNHIRYLRKRYKDPMSFDPASGKEKDFKLLHMQDVMLNGGPSLNGIPGLAGAQGVPGMAGVGGALGAGNQAGGIGALAAAASQLGGMQQGGLGQSSFGQSSFGQSSFGQGAGGGFGQSSSFGQGGSFGQSGGFGGTQSQSATQNSNNSGSSDSNSSNSSGSDSSGSSNQSNSSTTGGQNSGSNGAQGPNGQTFGGGAILGVASTDKKDKTIREFNSKTHYTDWYFIYDPNNDRGGLLVGPWQPLNLPTGGIGQPINGAAPGQTAGSQSGFGQSSSGFGQSGFGQSSGFVQQGGPGQSSSFGASSNSGQQNQNQPQPQNQ